MINHLAFSQNVKVKKSKKTRSSFKNIKRETFEMCFTLIFGFIKDL